VTADPDAEALRALGIDPLTDGASSAARAELARVARRLRASGRKLIGLLPASRGVGVVATGVQLGLQMAQLTGAPIAFVDANARWPVLSEIQRDAPADRAVFATRWLHGTLALLTPRRVGAAGGGVRDLERIVEEGREMFAHVLVDLTGFEELGEHLAAVDLLDGVVVVAAARETREQDLLRLARELPEELDLGVLLVGGRPPP
jgi:hypothetical protein